MNQDVSSKDLEQAKIQQGDKPIRAERKISALMHFTVEKTRGMKNETWPNLAMSSAGSPWRMETRLKRTQSTKNPGAKLGALHGGENLARKTRTGNKRVEETGTGMLLRENT
jgi:hypothetical protein